MKIILILTALINKLSVNYSKVLGVRAADPRTWQFIKSPLHCLIRVIWMTQTLTNFPQSQDQYIPEISPRMWLKHLVRKTCLRKICTVNNQIVMRVTTEDSKWNHRFYFAKSQCEHVHLTSISLKNTDEASHVYLRKHETFHDKKNSNGCVSHFCNLVYMRKCKNEP